MSKKIAVIESDSGLIQKLRGELEAKGFTVADTTDGKGAIELVKKERPDLVVLSVELSAGQSGYIICGKLKKDDELKKIPVVIIGKDAEGFESHKRLKARAEEYLKKPFDPPALIEKIGALIGLPEPAADDLVLEDESLNLGALGEDEPLGEDKKIETRGGDPDLDMLDAAFENIEEPGKEGASKQAAATESVTGEEPVEAPPEEGLIEEPPAVEEKALEDLGEAAKETEEAVDALHDEVKASGEDDLILDELEPVEDEEKKKPATPPPPPPSDSRPPTKNKVAKPAPVADAGEVHALNEKIAEFETTMRELKDQLAEKTNELEAFQNTTGGKDKEFFALKEQGTKKDKEIVRLKGEVNEKDQKLIELEEKLTSIEQKTGETNNEQAKKDAQIKTLTQRSESAAAERKKVEAALSAAKDELRAQSAKLSAAQGELDQSQEAQAELQKQLETVRAESASAKTALEALKTEFESVKTGADEAREKIESLQAEADKAAHLEEEAEGLRKRVTELEETSTKNEQRAVKAYQKIKADEKLREKTKKALGVALQMLEEASTSSSDGESVEEEEAVT